MNSVAASIQVSVCVARTIIRVRYSMARWSRLHLFSLSRWQGVCRSQPAGTVFQPVIVRVIDSSNPPHDVLGASVLFQSYVGRLPKNQPIVWTGEAGISQPGMPVILAKSQATAQSDINGLASFPLSTSGISGNVAMVGSPTAGTTSLQFVGQQLGP